MSCFDVGFFERPKDQPWGFKHTTLLLHRPHDENRLSGIWPTRTCNRETGENLIGGTFANQAIPDVPCAKALLYLNGQDLRTLPLKGTAEKSTLCNQGITGFRNEIS